MNQVLYKISLIVKFSQASDTCPPRRNFLRNARVRVRNKPWQSPLLGKILVSFQKFRKKNWDLYSVRLKVVKSNFGSFITFSCSCKSSFYQVQIFWEMILYNIFNEKLIRKCFTNSKPSIIRVSIVWWWACFGRVWAFELLSNVQELVTCKWANLT